jgi:hypothetical protein
MNDAHVFVSFTSFTQSSPPFTDSMAFGGKIFSVSHTVALLITASFATIFDPFRSVTPVARPLAPSKTILSTCDRSSRRPPFFVRPRVSASTIASEPPTGNSRVEFGRYQSSNMYPISAASVPARRRAAEQKAKRPPSSFA